jgi:hypothetical protein
MKSAAVGQISVSAPGFLHNPTEVYTSHTCLSRKIEKISGLNGLIIQLSRITQNSRVEPHG